MYRWNPVPPNWLMRTNPIREAKFHFYEDVITISLSGPLEQDPCDTYPPTEIIFHSWCCENPELKVLGMIQFSYWRNGIKRLKDHYDIDFHIINGLVTSMTRDCYYDNTGEINCEWFEGNSVPITGLKADILAYSTFLEEQGTIVELNGDINDFLGFQLPEAGLCYDFSNCDEGEGYYIIASSRYKFLEKYKIFDFCSINDADYENIILNSLALRSYLATHWPDVNLAEAVFELEAKDFIAIYPNDTAEFSDLYRDLIFVNIIRCPCPFGTGCRGNCGCQPPDQPCWKLETTTCVWYIPPQCLGGINPIPIPTIPPIGDLPTDWLIWPFPPGRIPEPTPVPDPPEDPTKDWDLDGPDFRPARLPVDSDIPTCPPGWTLVTTSRGWFCSREGYVWEIPDTTPGCPSGYVWNEGRQMCMPIQHLCSQVKYWTVRGGQGYPVYEYVGTVPRPGNSREISLFPVAAHTTITPNIVTESNGNKRTSLRFELLDMRFAVGGAFYSQFANNSRYFWRYGNVHEVYQGLWGTTINPDYLSSWNTLTVEPNLRFGPQCTPPTCTPREKGLWYIDGLYRYCLTTSLSDGIRAEFFLTAHAWSIQLEGCANDIITLEGESSCPIPFRPMLRPHLLQNGEYRSIHLPTSNPLRTGSLGIAIELGSMDFVRYPGCKENYPNECTNV